MTTNKSLSVALSLTLTILPASMAGARPYSPQIIGNVDAASAPDSKAGGKSKSDQIVYAPLRLTVLDNNSISAEFLAPLTNTYGGQILLAINGVDVRGKTSTEIYKLLRGKVGDSLEVEIVGDDRKVMKRKILITPSTDGSLRAYGPSELRGELLQLERSDGFRANVLESTQSPSDFKAKADLNKIISEYQSPVPGEPQSNKILLESLILSQSMGDLPLADKFADLAISKWQPRDSNSGIWMTLLPVAVSNLVATGDEDRALSLCKLAAKDAATSSCTNDERLQLIYSYAAITNAEGQNGVNKLLDQINEHSGPRQLASYSGIIWLCDYLCAHGQVERAKTLYDRSYSEIKTDILDRPVLVQSYMGLLGYPYMLQLLYKRARLTAESGDKSTAKAQLKEIEDFYTRAYTSQELAIANRIPELFPTPSDITQAIIALDKGLALARPRDQKLVSNYLNRPDDTEGGVALGVLKVFYKAVAAGKHDEAEASAARLVAMYKSQSTPVLQRFWDFSRLNFYRAGMRAARVMSDKGWYASSDRILHAMQSCLQQKQLPSNWREVAMLQVDAELCVNARRSGKDVESAFQILDRDYHSMSVDDGDDDDATRRDDSWRVRLRLLAMGYYYIADFDRAKIFIDRALLTNLPSRLSADDRSILTRDSDTGSQFMLLMDAACVTASKGDYQSAAKFASLSQAQKPKLDDPAATAILEYASCLSQVGKTQEAIDWLLLNRTITMPMPFKNLRDNIVERNQSPARDDLGGKIDEMLASLLYKQGKVKDAYKIITESVAKSNINTPQSACALAGELAEKMGDYNSAATYYEGANWHSSYTRVPAVAPGVYLKKAVENAEKFGKYDHKALSKMYSSMAQLSARSNTSAMYEYYKKAADCLPPDDPEKMKLLNIVSTYRNSTPVAHGPLTAEQIKSLKEAQIEDLRKIAALAEKTKNKQATQYWINLAYNEAQSGRQEQAIADAKHGIDLYGADSEVLSLGQGELLTARGLSSILNTPQWADALTGLQKLAVERIKSVHGAASVRAQWQLAQLFEFYVLQKKQDKALEVLTEILQTDLGQGPYQLPNHQSTHCGFGPYYVQTSESVVTKLVSVAQADTKDGNNSFATAVLEAILAAQQRQFRSDDRRIGVTWIALGNNYVAVKKYDKALTFYERALPIMLKYEEEQYVYPQLDPGYSVALKALGKQTYADIVAKHQSEKLQEEIAKRDKEVQEDQLRINRLISEKIGINSKVIQNHLSNKASQIQLLEYLDSYHNLQHQGNSSAQLDAAKKLEEFAQNYNLFTLRTLYMAERVKLSEALGKKDYDQNKEDYYTLSQWFISIKDQANAKIWLDKYGVLVSRSADDWAYLRWLQDDVKLGGKQFPTERSLKIEKRLLEVPDNQINDYNIGMLSQIKDMYATTGATTRSLALATEIDKLKKVHAVKEKARLDEEARQLKARQEYLSLSPLQRGDRAFTKVKNDLDKHDYNAFARDQSSIFFLINELSGDDRATFVLRCLDCARDLIKAHKFRESMAFLSVINWHLSGAGDQKIIASIEQTFDLCLQVADSDGAMYCLDALRSISRSGALEEGDNDILRAKIEKLRHLIFQDISNNVNLADEAQVRELGKGYCIKRTILAWKMLRLLDGCNAGTVEKEHQPLLLEDDTHYYRNDPARNVANMAPFKPAQSAPPDAKKLSTDAVQYVGTGDYVTSKFAGRAINFTAPGRTRLYLAGDSICDGPVFRLTQGGVIGSQPVKGRKGDKSTFEIWYSGEGTIQLDDGFDFNGLIYAPFARVELNGPTSGRFNGAIVARDVVVAGKVTLKYDQAYEYLNPK